MEQKDEMNAETCRVTYQDGILMMANSKGEVYTFKGDMDYEFMRRMAAAFNTCRYIPTEQLEADIVTTLMTGLEQSTKTIGQYRDYMNQEQKQ